ncbi:hypothetical protein GCM10028799_02090 [Kribbella italica]
MLAVLGVQLTPGRVLHPSGTRVLAKLLLEHNPGRFLLYLRESPTARQILTDIGTGGRALSHETLDARTTGAHCDPSIAYLRAVLVSVGALPVRDEFLARLERWIDHKLASIDDPEHRQLLTAFARWDRVARIRRRASGKPVSASVADVAQAQISKAAEFLNWLTDSGTALATAGKHMSIDVSPPHLTNAPTPPGHSSPGQSAASSPPTSISPPDLERCRNGRWTPTTPTRPETESQVC